LSCWHSCRGPRPRQRRCRRLARPKPGAWSSASSRPSATDPAIRHFDTAHYILFNTDAGPEANLLVFLSAARQQAKGGNPFHGEGIRNPAYAEQKAFLLGRSP
jgi:hypothetical protein